MELYRPIDEVYWQVPNDVDRPSQVPEDECAQVDKGNSELFHNTRVGNVISCE